MRLLHTSDWHLGRSLHGVDLIDEQASVMDRLIEVVDDEEIDAVLVAGDVYDRSVPPVSAVRLLDDVLCRLSEHTSVVVIPGNHDSSARLGFGARVFDDRISVRSELGRIAEPIELLDDHGTVLVYAVPYLFPDLARHELVGVDEQPLPRSHQSCTSAALAMIRRDLAARPADQRAVVMAHAFVVGASARPVESDSERDISVGGVDSVGADVFSGFAYVALGHLHGAQEPGTRDHGDGAVIRYSGSPLRYSFSESSQRKSFTIVELGARGVDTVRVVEIPQPRAMAQLSDSLAQLLEADRYAQFTDAWVQVSVTDPVRPSALYEQVRDRFPHALVVRHEPQAGALAEGSELVISSTDPLELARQFVSYVTGGEPTDAEMGVFRDAYEAARDDGREP